VEATEQIKKKEKRLVVINKCVNFIHIYTNYSFNQIVLILF